MGGLHKSVNIIFSHSNRSSGGHLLQQNAPIITITLDNDSIIGFSKIKK